MIVYYKAKGRPSGVTPKAKRTKKNNGFSIVIRNKASKSTKSSRAPTKDSVSIENKLTIINDCIENKCILEFEYCNKQGVTQLRAVEPQKLTKLNGATVLYAFCIQNEGLRIFILDNMRDLKKSELKNGRQQ